MEKLANISKFEDLQNQTNRTITNKGYVERGYVTPQEDGLRQYNKYSDFNLRDKNEFTDLYQILCTYSNLVRQGAITRQEALRQIKEAYGLGPEQIALFRDQVNKMHIGRTRI